MSRFRVKWTKRAKPNENGTEYIFGNWVIMIVFDVNRPLSIEQAHGISLLSCVRTYVYTR